MCKAVKRGTYSTTRWRCSIFFVLHLAHFGNQTLYFHSLCYKFTDYWTNFFHIDALTNFFSSKKFQFSFIWGSIKTLKILQNEHIIETEEVLVRKNRNRYHYKIENSFMKNGVYTFNKFRVLSITFYDECILSGSYQIKLYYNPHSNWRTQYD